MSIDDELLRQQAEENERHQNDFNECETGGDGNGNNKGQATGDEEDRRSVAEILVDLAVSNIKLFFQRPIWYCLCIGEHCRP